MAGWDDISAPASEAAPSPPAGNAYASVEPIAQGIASIESGGAKDPYAVTGPPTHTGDRAYGKYQIMGANVPSWTQEALGKSLTPQQFAADPDAQEQTAKFQLKKLYDKHGGNVKDVASVWHSGVPYDQAVAEGRQDGLGTKTADYATRVEQHVAGAGAAPPAAAPDAWDAISSVDMPEDAATTTPTTSTPPPAEKAARDQTQEEAAASINSGSGLAPDHWFGRYAAAFGKPTADALHDLYTTVTSGELATPTMDSLFKLLRPLGVPGEIAGEVVMQAGKDAGLDPRITAGLATAANLAMSAAMPVPWAKAAPELPLQGSTALKEAASAAESDAAAATAAVPKETPLPSPAAAKAAVSPAGVTAEQAGQAAPAGLEASLKEIKDPTQGIYKQVETNAANAAKGVDPGTYMHTSQQIQALKDELGSTLTGPAKDVLDGLKAKLDAGEKVTFKDLADYKTQLDTLLPGTTPRGATPKQAALYQFKWDVRKQMASMLDGDDKDWFDAANAMWKNEVIPRQKLLTLVQKKDPKEVVEGLFGNGNTDKLAARAEKVFSQLGDTTPAAEVLRQGVAGRMVARATVAGELDGAKLLKAYDAMHPDFQQAALTPGARNFFEAVRKTVTENATIPAAEKAAAKATDVATAARTAAQAPNTLAKLTAKGIEIGAVEAAGRVGLHVPGGAALGFFLPSDKLAAALARSPVANQLARALYLPANSALAPSVLLQLRQSGLFGETH